MFEEEYPEDWRDLCASLECEMWIWMVWRGRLAVCEEEEVCWRK